MAVLTISRQFGAGGKTLAQNIAARLNYDIASEAIIEELAERAKVEYYKLKSFEVEDTHLFSKSPGVFSPKHFIDRIFDPKKKYMDGKLYVDLLKQILPTIAEKDNLIILGRGAQFILKGAPKTYHILMVAEEKDRIQFMVDTYGLSMEDAGRTVRQQGKRRSKLMKLFDSEDFDLPRHYSLVLNMSKISMATAEDLVCDLVDPAKVCTIA
ncbi:Cytidylate kinase (EC [Olavius algarvensis associated proteobacterium Delta 3]|nr:Cytidylate kinase (EC [Olavius algarvensis associated proteobacterium Delta 3]